MKRMPPYSIIHVALPIHFTFPPFAPGSGSVAVKLGSLTVESPKVGNLSDGRVSVLVIVGGFWESWGLVAYCDDVTI